MFFWFAILCLFLILCFILFDYFLVKKWTKDMEKSIDNIFDSISKTTIVVFLLNLFQLNDDEKDNGGDDTGGHDGI